MSRIIDISVGLHPEIPVWPGSEQFSLKRIMRLEDGDVANVSQFNTEIHTGTHVDAPWHFIANGKTVEQLSLDVLIGSTVVAEISNTSITAEDLESLDLPQNTQRLLFHTRNSQLWQNKVTEFQKDFVALTADAARWIVDRGIKLIGVDYLSVQRFGDSSLTHEILLKAEVIVIEGLNLSGVKSGKYHLTCLPLKLVGAEGSPARAILIPQEA